MTAKPSHGAPPSSSATELGISVLLQSTIAIDDQQNGICGRLAAHDVEHLPITVKPLRQNGTHATHTTAESAISNHRDGLAASPTSVRRQGQVGHRDDRLRRTYPGARSTAAGVVVATRQSDRYRAVRFGAGLSPRLCAGQIPAAMTPGSSARVSTAGYWLSDGPQRPAFCLVSTAFRGSVLIIPGIVGSSPTRPTGLRAAQRPAG
jgi:hypothetical protein